MNSQRKPKRSEFHRWDFCLYKDFLVGEWFEAEVIRVTNANSHIYYTLRDVKTNKIKELYTPPDVRPNPAYSKSK